nr:hypothetical protein CFP56_65682 [Quercus suber]
MRTRRPPTLVMPLRSTAREGATRSLATAGLERTRKQRDVGRGEGQACKHRWWWSCGPQKLPFVAMIMKIRRRCPTVQPWPTSPCTHITFIDRSYDWNHPEYLLDDFA